MKNMQQMKKSELTNIISNRLQQLSKKDLRRILRRIIGESLLPMEEMEF